MNCDLCSFSNPSVASPTSQLISRAHSPTFPSLHLRHNSSSNPSVALPTSQLILQPFHRFTYITAHSPTLPLLHLCHSSFSNPSFASPMSQALHLIHLASHPWATTIFVKYCGFTVHLTPKNMTLSALPRIFLKLVVKYILIFCVSAT